MAWGDAELRRELEARLGPLSPDSWLYFSKQ
jgi:hypothetical protein